MIVPTFLLLYNVGRSWSQTPQPKYETPVRPVDIYKPETVHYVFVPRYFRSWFGVQEQAMYQAHLFAGKGEFPYVVWVKAQRQIQCLDPLVKKPPLLRRFSGAIITANSIMTACRPVAYPYCRNKNQSTWPAFPDGKFILDNPHGTDIPWYPGTNDLDTSVILCPERDIVITACEPNVYTVYYASVYLKEDNKFTDPFGHYVRDYENRFAGTRNAVEIVLHPKCAPHKTLQYDIGMITMEAPIMPNGPWIGLVPFLVTNTGLDDRVLEDEETYLCYIAAFNELNTGMPYNDDRQITRDYKVKFRTYKSDIEHCVAFGKVICWDYHLVYVKGFWTYLKLKWPELSDDEKKATGLECWETRHKVGVVCDIHAGAPLVCDGYAQGIVIRAADDDRCNNMMPQPFIVQRYYEKEVSQFMNDIVQSFPIDENVRPPLWKSESSRSSKNLLLVLSFIILGIELFI